MIPQTYLTRVEGTETSFTTKPGTQNFEIFLVPATKTEKVNLPRIEKKIINPADICTTLRLPTCVRASKPAFSLPGRKTE